MEGNSSESGTDYFDCLTDKSGSSSEELENQSGLSKEVADLKGKSEEQRTPTVRKFRRTDSYRRQTDNTTAADSDGKRTLSGDGYDICGYELQSPPRSDHSLKRLSMDDTPVRRKDDKKSQSRRSKVQEEVMKALFGPPDAKTPDEEKYELVEQEEVTRGVGRTGILFRFSMWATLGFITWVLGGRQAKVGCSDLLPNVRERDPVPKVIVRKEIS